MRPVRRFHSVRIGLETCLCASTNNKYSVAASAVGSFEVLPMRRIVIRQDGRIVANIPIVRPRRHAL